MSQFGLFDFSTRLEASSACGDPSDLSSSAVPDTVKSSWHLERSDISQDTEIS